MSPVPLIVFATTVKDRAFHIKETLPRNLADNPGPNSKFLILNYNSPDDLIPYLKTNHAANIASGKLIVYHFHAPGPFRVAHAKNMAARLAIREGADILITLDADNFTGSNFDKFVLEKLEPGAFLCPNHAQIRTMSWEPSAGRPNRGFAGRLAVRAHDFIKAGGYNEIYDTWRGEDIDFNARMERMGYTMQFIDNSYLKTIPHSAQVRFKEYPQARQYDQPGAWKIAGRQADTIVNYGNFGLGTVYKNDDPKPIILHAVPTRIFGIGLHKTATTSLHKAFQLLGFDSLHWGHGEAPLIWDEVNSAGRSKTLERFYTACDLPIPILYQKLDLVYPGSKFILTIRDEQKWLKSVERLWDPEYNPSRWEWDVWPISHRLHHALYGRIDFNAETMLATYRRHNSEVRKYFTHRPKDLLIMNMDAGAGWKELCHFLGESVPCDNPRTASPYPRMYVTKRQETVSSCDGVEDSVETSVEKPTKALEHAEQKRKNAITKFANEFTRDHLSKQHLYEPAVIAIIVSTLFGAFIVGIVIAIMLARH